MFVFHSWQTVLGFFLARTLQCLEFDRVLYAWKTKETKQESLKMSKVLQGPRVLQCFLFDWTVSILWPFLLTCYLPKGSNTSSEKQKHKLFLTIYSFPEP